MSGKALRPSPSMIPIYARAMGRRRMNQLLTAVEAPSSRGLENTARPGTYKA